MKKKSNIKRRDFLKGAAAVGAGLVILPSGVLSGENAPSNKLNIALIGAYGRAEAHYEGLKKENVVAICDVDEEHLGLAAKEFPNAKHYIDWRKCLEQKDLDAVVCCTPDHTHAFIGTWAMNRGLHLYMEKPMGISVEEVRLVRQTYLKNKNKLAVQHGTQRHQNPNFDRVRELIHDDAIGELQAVHAWGNRQLRKDGYPAAEGEPPETLHYDLWLGPSPYHPYNPEYFSSDRLGMNCLQWNMYWDFGTGQVGDMGSHTMDLVWNVIEAGIPLSVEATGDEFNPEVTPVELKAVFKHPANSWRPAIDVVWHQGGAMPSSPREYVDLNKIDHGALFKGSKGFLVSSFDERLIIPFGDDADMTYYNRRGKDEVIEPMGDFQQEWIDACKGDLKTSCDLDYAGTMMEQLLLGLVAYRVGKEIEYDGDKGRVTNSDEANALLSREYRPGWALNG
jgi:predicted dehydrogenase